MHLLDLLADRRRYRAEIDRLHVKHGHTSKSYELRQDGVSFMAISSRRGRVARLLATSVATGEYRLEPARTRWIVVRGRRRLLHDYRLTDRIVHGAVASMISDAIQPHLSPRLYSYRKGRAWTRAVSDFASYVREHRRTRSDPKARGLYVLRRDIEEYTDTIPLDEDSRIWPLLREALHSDVNDDLSGDHWALLRQVVRTEFCGEDGALATKIRGVPTGSPVAPPIFNLYLTSMDHELGSIPGAFYARYCDDFLFAHSRADVVRRVDRRIDEILAGLRLATNKSKDRRLYFNGAGRSSDEWPEARAANAVPFLGCTISFAGTVSLSPDKVRRLLHDLSARARRTFALAGSGSPEAAGPVVCAAINAALTPRERFSQKWARLLGTVVTDRGQLRDLDYQIALVVLRALTGVETVRAFRRIPYVRLRREWNLKSLYHARNRSGRRRQA